MLESGSGKGERKAVEINHSNPDFDIAGGCGSYYLYKGQVGGNDEMNQEVLLDIRHLQKGYKNFPVLKDVTFQCRKGRILGLIGKNGAGKTTLMKSVLGLNTNYQGTILFDGKKLNPSDGNMKARMGSLVDVVFYEDMTAWQNMKVAVMLTDSVPLSEQKSRIEELLSFVGLTEAKNKCVRNFSFGMKQRLALAQSLLTRPEILILDEPFVGLDPIGIEEVKDLLRSLCRENQTAIIFSSHQLTEVCDLADDIAVLNDGVIKYADTYMNLKKSGASLIELMR
ncbi:ABC transporter ATP-binding protein [Faecalicatena sp. AGMB00832]|uniref:ABC transporter ATP-binding protein n=1 Tax=Faecalicatena faecalis TaxID=2726362 RepID=A0ABS6D1N2_9FIRM|nr:ABC transporter ATP-binding protein [Faecalicatena faecalis]MBU3875423.1 ABC transporter ATP-binding protein [Faecalicatena faecalis]